MDICLQVKTVVVGVGKGMGVGRKEVGPHRRFVNLLLLLSILTRTCGAQGLRGRVDNPFNLSGLGLESTMAAAEESMGAALDSLSGLAKFRASEMLGTGAVLKGTFIRAVSENSPSRDELLPMCGWVEPIVELDLFCGLLRYIQEQMRPSMVRSTAFRDSGMYNNDRAPAQNSGGTLPMALVDLGFPLPYIVNATVIEIERHTVYFYYRLIVNLYSYSIRVIRAFGNTDGLKPAFVPDGYGSSRIYNLNEGWGNFRASFDAPIGQSFVKGTHMILLFRGTLLPGGWLSDMTYSYSPEPISSTWGFEGRVHQGFFNFTIDILPQVEEEIGRHPDVTRLTIAGHSLGGAVGTLLADYLARKQPSLVVELIGLAAPNVGNGDFVRGFNQRVQARRVSYLGDGVKTTQGPYGFGDVIPQIPPPCWRVPSCGGTLFGDPRLLGNDGWAGGFEYKMAGGNVPFYATDMPNSDEWLKKERLVTWDSSLSACHVCAYLCWSVQGLPDAEDRCQFNTEDGEHPYPCPYATLGQRIDDVVSGRVTPFVGSETEVETAASTAPPTSV